MTTLPLTPVTPGTLGLGVGISVTGTRTPGYVPLVQSGGTVAWDGGLSSMAFAPNWPNPITPTPTMITTFASGHGWTAASHSVTLTNLNDTTDFVLGTQSAKVESPGTGACTFGKLAMTAINMTGKMFQVWVKLDDVTNYSSLQMYAGDTSLANYYLLNILDNSSSSAIKAGEWIPVRFGFNGAAVTGSPNRAAITDLRFRFADNNTAVKVVAHFNGVATMADSTSFPNGVISISADDGYLTQHTNAGPVLDKYGYPLTAFIIVDAVGTASHMTLAQLQSRQRNSGWEIASHAATQANHDLRYSNMTAEALAVELRTAKAYVAANGFRGSDQFAYPGGTSTDWNATTEGVVSQFFRTARLTTNWPRQKWPPAMPYRVGCLTVLSSSSVLATLQTEIDRAYTEKDWLHIFFHSIGGGGTDMTTANFTTLIDYIAAKGIPVKTITDVMRTAS